ncbi:MAG: hypothetical protein HGA44_01640, partial [Cellulomonadaceae bacterium]|nr:hypothetical protein [Cellulomonadaceae bacterium]
MSAQAWTPGTEAAVEIALHQGRDDGDPLPVTLVIDRDDAAPPAAYVFLDVAPDATWAPILGAATAALRAIGCPAGPVTSAGQPVREVEDCGCSWLVRPLAIPTAGGDTETE